MTRQRTKEQGARQDKDHHDTVVGSVGETMEVRRESDSLTVMEFQLTTFGFPTEISVERRWNPLSEEKPEIQPESVLRIWGWLDAGDAKMEAERTEDPGDREISVLVCGGRKFAGWPAVQRVLDRISPDVIIHGAATGADTMAGRYAKENDIACRSFPAKWRVQTGNGRWTTNRAAGHERNQRMLDEGKPDLVVAFPGGTGTSNMVKISRQQGFRVYIIGHQGERKYGNAPVVQG